VSASYYQELNEALGAFLYVDFRTDRGEVVNYRVVLLLARREYIETIRVYDSAHGYNEMHRFTHAGGKQTGKPFHSGSLGEGLRVAIESAKRNYLGMIEGWSND
jgi:hypothetical protein